MSAVSADSAVTADLGDLVGLADERGRSVSVARLPSRSPVSRLIGAAISALIGYACGSDIASLIDANLGASLGVITAFSALAAMLMPARRWRESAILGLGIVMITLIGAGGSFPAFLQGLGSGWRELLSTTVLAPNQASVRVIPMVIAFSVTWAVAALHRRSRQGLAPLGPVIVGVTVTTLLGGSLASLSSRSMFGIVFPVCALLMLRAVASVASASLRSRPAGAIATVAVAGLVGVSAAALTVVRDPIRTERNVVASADLVRFLNPTQIVADQRRNRPETPILRTNLTPGTNWRLVTMDLYRPSGWDTSTPLLASGSQLSSPVDAVRGAFATAVSVQVLDTSLPLLPLPDRTTGVDVGRVLHDPVSGAVRVDPDVYRRVISLDVEIRLANAAPSEASPRSDAELERYRSLPSGDAAADRLLPALFAKSTEIVEPRSGEQVGGLQRAIAIANFMRGPTFSVDDRGGSGTLALVPLAEIVLLPGERTARPEQYVTLFALLARLQGLPVRIVAGYRQGLAVDGGTVFLGKHAAIWPEVHLPGRGWLAFDPVPQRSGASVDDRQTEAIGDDPSSAGGSVGFGPGFSPATLPLPGRDRGVGETGRRSLHAWWVGIALILVAIAALVIRIRMVGTRRRRARTTGTEDQRIMAAWRDAISTLSSVGVRATPAMTAEEVVALAAPALTTPVALRELASLTNLVRYAPEPVPPEAVTRAWTIADVIGDEIAAASGFVYRVQRAIGITATTPTTSGVRPSTA